MNVATLNGAAPVAAPTAKPVLTGLKKTRVERPFSILLYGVEGIGKSTFASDAPEPIFLGAEDGTSELEVVRYPHKLVRWRDLGEAVETLRTRPHSFQTVVLDTVDWAEPLCWQHVCEEGGKKSIEDFGYGKGYIAAQEHWRELTKRLEALRDERRMNLILLGHSQVRTFKNPEGDDFDRYTLKMHDKSAGLLKEWVDAVLFANYETYHREQKNGRAKGVSTGARIIHTERRAAFDAKNRYSLPETLPLNWNEFSEAMSARRGGDLVALRAQIEALLVDLGDEAFGAKIRAQLPNIADPAKLREGINRIVAKIQQKENA